ncbi:hypothetical protein ABIE26_003808 [Pedobacter africanus]
MPHFSKTPNYNNETITMKLYDIFLNNNKIGTTELEKGDAPMGSVFGKITFINISSGYDFFKTHCVTNGIELVTDYPEDRLILGRCSISIL